MRRLVPATSLVCLLAGCAFLFSCSSGTSTRVVTNPIPASVSLTPGPNASVEIGKILTFTPSAKNALGNAVTETFTYQSSDPSVLTVSNTGIACGGVWDSVTAPVVCTPGGTGIALITAIANGVSSPPVTVYVHQRVTTVVIQKVPGQPQTLSTACYSSGAPQGPESALYEAFAYGGPGGSTDLTLSVGPFGWGGATLPGQILSRVVDLSSPGASAPTNQEIATAGVPGSTAIFATVAGVTSQPLQFTTCPVQSISLQLAPGSSLSLPSSGGSATVNAVVKDTVGMSLTALPLTWTSSFPQSLAVVGGTSSVFGSEGTVTSSTEGKAAITAACTPPTCNGGFTPSMPVYPTTSLVFQAANTSTPPNPTTYVTTSACSETTLSCTTRIIPIIKSSSTAAFSAGFPSNLTFTPNSFVLGSSAGLSYLGVDSAGFNSQGLMVFSGSSVSQLGGAAGRVLAVSPDSATVILSDTVDSPSRINICKNCNSSVRTFSTIFFPNASAAAFSPDNLKAYIVSSSPCPGGGGNGCILVYSQVDSLQYVPLSAPATDTAFIDNGTAGFIGEGGQAEFLPTCGPNGVGSLGSVNLAAESLRPLSDGMSLLALTPPNLQTVTVNITGSASGANSIGCPSPRGFLNITNTFGPVVNLGTGSFVTKQFFLSPDSSKAYILAQTGAGAYFPFIIVFDVATGTSSEISLAGSAIPLSAGTSPAGDLLLVGANDNSVHVVDTQSGLDLQQVALSFPNASLCIGPGNPATQVAIASLTIASAQQSGTNTVLAYSLQNGATPQVGQTLVLTGMSDSGNNGTFTILAVNAATSSSGTVTVSNPAGVTASGQTGAGTVPLSCNPDLLVTVP